MMIHPDHRELIEGHPDLDVVILYDKQGREKTLRGNLRFALQLKTHRFDTAVILHSTHRVILVSWLAGIRRRIGYARRLPWLLTDRLPYLKPEGDRHEWEYNVKLLKFLKVSSSDQQLYLPTTAAQQAKVTSFLRDGGHRGDQLLIGLHPGASCPSKRWPPERFAAVADYLIQHHKAQVVVVTGPKESKFGEAVVKRMGHPAIRAFGTFTLGELACLFQKTHCLISNDSGPVHIASAVGTPVVAIFGRWGGGLSPTRWGPTGPNSVSLHHDVGCRPCLAHRCPIGFICLEAVSVEEVLAAVEGTLHKGTLLSR